ncbi:MAG: ABC transporter permease [Clostridia bacterium]|nr:ABC transporter permease [Clostridia bacterium]
MKKFLYPRLAWTGIRKNKRLYAPYLLTCAGMVMMHYIITALNYSSAVHSLRGGSTIAFTLELGSWIIALFSLIFLFYTNSFLIRRRMKEFGLYNILGMGKGNIARILVWETLISAALTLSTGLFGGFALSKLAELGLVNIMKGEVSYHIELSMQAVLTTVPLFCAIFALILLAGLIRIGKTDAIALLRSENAGEKPPKANWFLGVLGALLLGGAYYLAVSIQDPISALIWFFVAVGMVILATYLLFVAGSVVICRALQRNKRYYYKPNHFVSVSSMAYRMKRNGAGLASICILATMVLVMLCSTSCLYFGAEDSLNTRYPMNLTADLLFDRAITRDDPALEIVRSTTMQACADHGVAPDLVTEYRHADITGCLTGTQIDPNPANFEYDSVEVYGDVRVLHFIPLEDYNSFAGANEVLNPGEALIYATRTPYKGDDLEIVGGAKLRIVKQLDSFPVDGVAATDMFSHFILVVPNFEEVLAPLSGLTNARGDLLLDVKWFYGVDMHAEDNVQVAIWKELYGKLGERLDAAGEGDVGFYIESRAENREDFYGTYGGLFFLGIALSIVFLFAAVLIIYYKQVTEGYEDQHRFEIMQKVGMTKRDIRKSINSQLLTVFFLPLIAAGVHLAFAFPMIRKLLMMFNLFNLKLLMCTTTISYLIFALFYLMVYRITSNAYYAIVSDGKVE